MSFFLPLVVSFHFSVNGWYFFCEWIFFKSMPCSCDNKAVHNSEKCWQANPLPFYFFLIVTLFKLISNPKFPNKPRCLKALGPGADPPSNLNATLLCPKQFKNAAWENNWLASTCLLLRRPLRSILWQRGPLLE